MPRQTTSERIAACAFRHWRRAGMTEWPSVRQVCKRLRINQTDIEENDDGHFITTSFNVMGGERFGNHFVEAMTEDVDRAWEEYWRPYSRQWGAECAS